MVILYIVLGIFTSGWIMSFAEKYNLISLNNETKWFLFVEKMKKYSKNEPKKTEENNNE